MLPAAHRLTDPGAFSRTVRSGRRAGSPTVVVHLLTGVHDHRPARVGLVVSKGVGNAVTRNRVKRRLRHQAAAILPDLPSGSDLVVRALPPAAGTDSARLGEELRRTVGRCLQRTPEMTS